MRCRAGLVPGLRAPVLVTATGLTCGVSFVAWPLVNRPTMMLSSFFACSCCVAHQLSLAHRALLLAVVGAATAAGLLGNLVVRTLILHPSPAFGLPMLIERARLSRVQKQVLLLGLARRLLKQLRDGRGLGLIQRCLLECRPSQSNR